MTREVTLPAGAASTLTFQARWNIEDCGPDACDYAYVEVDDGSGYKPIAGSITKPAEGNGIDGDQADWTPATFDLSAYAGKTIKLRFRYRTDGAAQGTDPNGSRASSSTTSRSPSGGDDRVRRRRRGRRRRLDARRLPRCRRDGDDRLRQLLRRVEPAVRLLRPVPAVRAVQLRVPGHSRTGWSTSPTRTACSCPTGTPRSRTTTRASTSGQGEILPIDSHPEPIYNLDGLAVARADPDLRRAVLAGEGGLVHAARPERARQLHPRPGGRSRCSTTAATYWNPTLPRRGREGARTRASRSACCPRTAPRCGSGCSPLRRRSLATSRVRRAVRWEVSAAPQSPGPVAGLS